MVPITIREPGAWNGLNFILDISLAAHNPFFRPVVCILRAQFESQLRANHLCPAPIQTHDGTHSAQTAPIPPQTRRFPQVRAVPGRIRNRHALSFPMPALRYAEISEHLASRGADFLRLAFLLHASCALEPLLDYVKATGRFAELETEQLYTGNLPKTQANGINANQPPRKRAPVPVSLVDSDPAKMMDPDEYGAELGREARVWKIYHKETDKWDEELINGWNDSLDVILVFVSAIHFDDIVPTSIHTNDQAGLFSTISTTFLIESSRMLQQDSSDVSATALVSISQLLLNIANGSSVNLDDPTFPSPYEMYDYEPSQHAVVVNTLWYLSLSLSIATSLLAMLAKDWCHSFIANRTGHPWDQALRRQRKWVMIERWKMQELITVLPSLMHISLLLFAIGLCIYVWDMNTAAAIPILIISGGLFTFYLWSSLMASFVKLFPYTTVISRMLQSDFMHHQYKRLVLHGRRCIVWLLSWMQELVQFSLTTMFCVCGLCLAVLCLPLLVGELSHWAIFSSRPWASFEIEETHWYLFIDGVAKVTGDNLGTKVFFEKVQSLFAGAKKYVESTPQVPDDQDQMISLALQWLIQNCETPSSVAIALQAIAGASSRIPTKPLESCEAALKILQRLVSSNSANQRSGDTELYTRALAFLESKANPDKDLQQDESGNLAAQTSQRCEGIEVVIWDLNAEHERQVVELINTTQLSPTNENIRALSIGSSATSLGLRLLKGDVKPASEAFGSIIQELCRANSHQPKLDPAALQSLANAAVVLTLSAQSSLLTPDMLQACIDYCVSSLPVRSEPNPPPPPQPTITMATEIALLLCILLNPNSLSQTTLHPLQINLSARAQQVVHTLTSNYMKNTLFQSMFYRVGLLAVLFNQERYGITGDLRKTPSKKQIAVCRNYSTSELLISSRIQHSLREKPESVDNTEISAFLWAVEQVSNLTGVGVPSIPMAITLPAPVYCVLVYLSCTLRSEGQQAQCQRLLSSGAFPKLDVYFVAAVREMIAGRSLLQVLWSSYKDSKTGSAALNQPWRLPISEKWRPRNADAVFKARLRHFSATQLWLLLFLIGNSSTDLQKMLEARVERDTDLRIEDRAQLEEEIMNGYESGHTFGDYSARIVECILQGRGVPPNDSLYQRVMRDLENVPPKIRAQSPLLDLPPYPQPDSTLDNPQHRPASFPNARFSNAPTVEQSNQQLSIIESDLTSSSFFTRARNTELPSSTASISIPEDDEPDDIDNLEAPSSAGHVSIFVRPGATESENA